MSHVLITNAHIRWHRSMAQGFVHPQRVPGICRGDGLLVQALAGGHGVAVQRDAAADLGEVVVGRLQRDCGVAERLHHRAGPVLPAVQVAQLVGQQHPLHARV